jgi:hypothetical protein
MRKQMPVVLEGQMTARIRELFSDRRPIDRPIEKVIDYTADEPDRLAREIDEYVVTERLEENRSAALSRSTRRVSDLGTSPRSVSGSPAFTAPAKAPSPSTSASPWTPTGLWEI